MMYYRRNHVMGNFTTLRLMLVSLLLCTIPIVHLHSLVVLDCRFADLNGIYYTIDCYPPIGGTGSKGYGLRIEDDADLVLYLNLDEGSGNIAHDLSGNDNHGTIHGAKWVTGKIGGALFFDGVDDYIEIPSSSSLNSIVSQITILAWVKTNYTQRGTIVANWYYDKSVDPKVNKRSYVCTVNEDGKPDFGLSGDGKSGTFIKSVESIDRNEWTHLAFVSNGSTMSIYVNGRLTASAEAPSEIYRSNRNVYIGVWNAKEPEGPEFNTFFKGIIDEIKIYRRALSYEEILQDYMRGTGKGRISGKVTYNGKPLSDVDVKCLYLDYSTRTDENGFFELELPYGSYMLKFSKPGYMVELVVVETNKTVNIEMRKAKKIIYIAKEGGDYNCDGIDDHIEINAAIETLSMIGGGTVHLREGTYTISDSINLCSNIVFEGEGEDKTVIKLEDGNTKEFWALINIKYANNVTVRNFTLDGNKDKCPVPKGINSDVDAFDIQYSENIVIEYVNIIDFWTDGVEFVHSNNALVDNVKCIQCGHEGLRAIYSDYIVFSNNYIYSAGTGNAGIRIYESSYCIIEKNYFNVYGFGILINPQGGVPCGNNIYRDNYIEGHYGLPGIALWPWNTEISNETFIRNIIAKTDGTQEPHGHGIELRTRGTSKLRDIRIINNVINNARRSGIYVEDGADVSNIIVKNNIIVNNREYGIYGKVISSYNDVWNNAAGNYGGGASPGKGDISVDPLFADPGGGDFHLKSEYGRWDPELGKWVYDSVTSPCIDAGDPGDDYSNEPEPNGGRINMGAYGNTPEASRSPGLEVQRVELEKGWNLISVVVKSKTPYKASDLAKDLGTNCKLVAKWDSNSQKYMTYIPGFSPEEYNFEIEPEYGYFVYLESSTIVGLSGTPVKVDTIELKKGWNLVGWDRDETSAKEIAQSIGGECKLLAKWDSNSQKYTTYIPGFSPEEYNFKVKRGEAIFIYMEKEKTWTKP